jgi:membrane-associated phospholipid phosphatase
MQPFKNDLPALYITWLLHPLFLPVYVLLWLLFGNSYFSLTVPGSVKLQLIGLTAITTIIFPFVFIIMLFRKRVIQSLYMEKREDRVYPFLITSVFFSLTFHLFQKIHILFGFQIFMLGATLLILLSMLINFKRKISIHMVGAGGVFGFLTGLSHQMNEIYLLPISLCLLLAGLVGYARLKLNAHSPVQVYLGFVTGVAGMILIFIVQQIRTG